MRIVFMGTAEFAIPSLYGLIQAGHDVILVITQPDRPKGRGQKLKPGPIKESAGDWGLNVFQPENIKDPTVHRLIRELDPQVLVVVAYGKILPEEVLNLPSLGSINVHGSLLPYYRGAAPIQRAIMAGEKKMGVTTMYMDKGMDTGDIILQYEVDVSGEEDHGELAALLADHGAQLLVDTIECIEAGKAPRVPQDHSRATYAPPLTRDDELIEWNQESHCIRNQIRGLSPSPGAYTWWRENKLKVFRAEIVEDVVPEAIGKVIEIVPDQGFVVGTGRGGLMIIEVQKPGKKRISASEFLKGNDLRVGEHLGR
ncbi:MAG: methionyl-tRNA formyltransferase [Syntrophomonadaceae bacterium]|nr:methionyl-tRNA formyltransferase [Syntrophomonadaceae bacterium]